MGFFRQAKHQDGPANAVAVSLDFTERVPQPAAPVAAPAKKKRRRKPLPAQAQTPAAAPRRFVAPVLVAVAIGAAITYVLSEPPAVPVTPPVAAVRKPAPPAHAPRPAVSPKAAAPAAKAAVPNGEPPAPPRVQIPAVPTAFLVPFQAYTTLPGNKAIALALDKDGRFAHATVARHPVQAEANEEALSDCGRHRAEAAIQQSCRLFAVGDKIVW
jgi:hypothetical protein